MGIVKNSQSGSWGRRAGRGERDGGGKRATRKMLKTKSSLASGGAYRILPLIGRSTLSAVAILQLEGVQPLLVVFGAVGLVDARHGVGAGPVGSAAVNLLPAIGLLRDGGPFPLADGLSGRGAVLLLGVLMRAVVEQLGIDFHKQFHGVINHAMDSSVGEKKKRFSIFAIGGMS